jgi:hypothetical protein
MTIKMFVILDKAKPDIENIGGLNLAAARHMVVVAEAGIYIYYHA